MPVEYTNQTVQVPVEEYPWFNYSFQLRAGVLLIAEVAIVSFISVSVLLTVVTVRTLKRWKRNREGRALEGDEPTQPVALLFILAMCMELVQAFASSMSIRWSWQGTTTEGHYCTAQAVLKQLGNDGAALFTMFLAIMTVIPTMWPDTLTPRKGRRIVLGMIVFVVVFWLLMITVPATTIKNYYGSTGPWCWIPTKKDGFVIKRNQMMGILTEYGWFWLASFTCFICYGYIVVRWWREADGDNRLIGEAVVMVWYPIAYFIEIFPQSVARLLQLHAALKGKHPPHNGWTILTSVMFVSSGWVNVLLWVLTGRKFGFNASTVRALPGGEAGHDLGGAALPRGDQARPRPTAGTYGRGFPYQRDSEGERPFIPPQPAFPPSHTSEPSEISMSPFSTPTRTVYDNLAAYQPGVYDPYGDQPRR